MRRRHAGGSLKIYHQDTKTQRFTKGNKKDRLRLAGAYPFLFSWCFLVSWCLSGESLSPLPCGPDLHQVDVVRVQPAVDGLAAYPKPPGEGGDIAPFRQQEFFQLGPVRPGRKCGDPGSYQGQARLRPLKGKRQIPFPDQGGLDYAGREQAIASRTAQ